MKLRFGTAGIPIAAKKYEDSFPTLNKLGMEAMELEFVRSINVSEKKVSEIKKLAEKHDITLTCHGSYYINLNAEEQEKVDASIKRVFDGASRADACGAKSYVFHAGFFLKKTPEETFQKIKKNYKKILELKEQHGLKIDIRPETTGKPTQFGSLEDLKRLHDETGVIPCVDFAHLHARHGKQNTPEEFHNTLIMLEKEFDCIKNMHIHMSGIAYGEKGEKHHLPLDESDFQWKELLKVWKEFDIKGVVISESPNIEVDGKKMKEYYNGL